MKKRYAVTGGAGFIGSQVVRTLLKHDADRVVVIDNLATGSDANLDEIRNDIDFHRIDIRDFSRFREALNGCEYVAHLAAIPSVPRSIEDPVPSHDVNINGTFNVFRAAHEAGVKRVFFAGSSSAYGDTEVLPKYEGMLPRPKSPYAAQKVLGEMYGKVFSECYGLEVVSLRFFNVYGPRQDPSSAYSGVLSIFMRCILEASVPLIHGDGEQSRDFTYVEDVAELVYKALHADGVAGQVVNAGNGDRFTLNMVWETLQQITGVKIQAKYGPDRPGDVRHSQADTTEAKQLLNHVPRFSLEEGLRQTFEWYKKDALTRGALKV
ncbi:MAG TPA: SDR family oxidoreductase [Bryobacteraceae bacterium]|nr:SDR family oxidoreductase [Bryobacteraceae bacterium]